MRKSVFLLVFILILTVHTFSQSTDSNTSAAENKSAAASKDSNSANGNTQPQSKKPSPDAPKTDTTPIKANKFNLPPEKMKPVVVTKFATPPVIDGKVDEEVWKTAFAFKDFYQIQPGDNIAASKPTEAFLGYDEKFLYIAFRCYDEPDKVRATIAKRDEVFNEDNVRIWFDTFNDQRRAYVIGFNPLGIQQDGILTEGQGADFSVDIVMESKGVMLPDGWSVEAKIPFKSLRYVAGKGKFWGINVARNIDRLNDEFDTWMPNDRNNSSFLGQFGKLTGLNDIKTERTLEIIPSVTMAQSGERRFDSSRPNFSRFAESPFHKEFGANIKYSITPTVTLDAAINPDFAEVEADAPVVTANQRFPIFFEEKRPFFLEGVDIFQSPITVLYTRTIQNPDIATKLTGKIGKNSFGILAALDRPFGSDDKATVGVLRFKRDIGKENNLGFYATARSFPNRHNYLGGFDGRFRFDDKTVLNFQAVGSNSRRYFYNPVIDDSRYRTGNGVAYAWNLDHTGKNSGWFLEGSGRSKDYRADVGFNRRTNTNNIFAFGRLSTEPKPKAKIIRLRLNNGIGLDYDWQGHSQGWNGFSSLNFNFQRNTFAGVNVNYGYERLFEYEFGAKRSAHQQGAFFGKPERSANYVSFSGFVETSPVKRFSLSGGIGTTLNQFDLDFGACPRFPRASPNAFNFPTCDNSFSDSLQQNPGTGRQFDLELSAEFKPIDPLRISVDYTKSRLVRNDTGKTAFDTNIFSLHSTYQFSRFTFLRARWDYYTLDNNFDGQFVFGWNPTPGTAIYAGYNDNFNYRGYNQYADVVTRENGFERNSRTFFVRMSYLFRRSF